MTIQFYKVGVKIVPTLHFVVRIKLDSTNKMHECSLCALYLLSHLNLFITLWDRLFFILSLEIWTCECVEDLLFVPLDALLSLHYPTLCTIVGTYVDNIMGTLTLWFPAGLDSWWTLARDRRVRRVKSGIDYLMQLLPQSKIILLSRQSSSYNSPHYSLFPLHPGMVIGHCY